MVCRTVKASIIVSAARSEDVIIRFPTSGLDKVLDAEERYGGPGGLFDEIAQFLVDHLRTAAIV